MSLKHVKQMVPLILLPWILEISASLVTISKQGVSVETVVQSAVSHEVKKEISKSPTSTETNSSSQKKEKNEME